jgi:hypothetical protein
MESLESTANSLIAVSEKIAANQIHDTRNNA